MVSPTNVWGINKTYKSGVMCNFLRYCYERRGYIYTLARAQCLTMANPLKVLTIMIMHFSLSNKAFFLPELIFHGSKTSNINESISIVIIKELTHSLLN